MAKRPMHTIHFHGRLEGVKASGPMVLATDGSTDTGRAAAGYVSSYGHYGLAGHQYPNDISGASRSAVVELRAVHIGLEQVLASIPERTPVRVILDSLEALKHLKDWQKGGDSMPEGYRDWRLSGNESTLGKLHRLVSATPNLRFRHQPGHVGHPLNETADSLAKLGLRVSKGMVEKDVAKRLAPLWAEQAVAAYADTQRTGTA
ncbi:RNase H family protein [Streptomyces sp. NPDC001221]